MVVDGVRVGLHVLRRREEQQQVHAERPLRGAAQLGPGPGDAVRAVPAAAEHAQAARFRDGGDEPGNGGPRSHPAEDDRVLDPEQLRDSRPQCHVWLLLSSR